MRSITASLCLTYLASSILVQLIQTVQSKKFETAEHEIYETKQLVNINGSLFYISDTIVPYDDALLTCNGIDMKLISIESEEKDLLIDEYLLANGYEGIPFWTSGIRVYGPMFMWSATGRHFEYTNWNVNDQEPDHPADGVDVCVYIDTLGQNSFKFHDVLCHYEFRFICEQ